MAELEGQAGTEHKIVRIDTEALCERCRLIAFGLKKEMHLGEEYVQPLINRSKKCPLCLWLLEIFRIPMEIMNPAAVFHYSKVPGPCFSYGRIPYWHCPSDSGLDYSHYYLLPLDDGKSTTNLEDRYRLVDCHKVDFDRLRYWINYCQTNHGHACSRITQMNGTPLAEESAIKVIDCKQRMITGAALSVPYVALSYVWGTGVSEIIEEEPSPDGNLRNVLPDSLPRTIEDAIYTTLQLGYRYLWVDKYCIDQSNPHELHTQLSLMNLIYQAASVTIVAASGADSNSGLPGVSDRPRTPQILMHLDRTTWLVANNDPETSVRRAVWSTRAWTYQESFFSRRQLFFTDQQVLFECCEMSCCELVDRPLDKATERGWHITRQGIGDDMSPAHGGKDLPSHISEYSIRSLTYQPDVLRAMQGIFSYFATPSLDEADRRLQFWGICISPNAYEAKVPAASADEQLRLSLAQGLCWLHGKTRDYTQRQTRRNQFPSWSWSGWGMPIAWPISGQSRLSPGDFSCAITLEKHSGARVPFTAALAENLCTMSPESTDYTYRLHLRTEIMDIGVTYLGSTQYTSENGLNYVVSAMAHEIISSSRRESEQSSEQPNSSPQQILYWPIEITPFVEAGTELHERLCREVLKCIVLPNDRGLVVWKGETAFERLGIIWKLSEPHGGSYAERFIGQNMREYFPSSIQEITLE
ncbi:heterokaryon incompatibility protein-domain-containing protein [Paraphoma chrysanthemicola]|uniref:Heterokaryon incompatibility protein-domain-containing protein n=1 Tax=Paraphoma chrysanthemicola TaxID=798071 RepID=A0A8K0RIA7_9PLEO|nr:heterokaryon incompatibility protein-domain-containing protein [Paraphoma chrysanthemicola]